MTPLLLQVKGIFRTAKVIDGKVCCWQAHINKLRADCASISIAMPEVSERGIRLFLEENGADKGIWRLRLIIDGSIHFQIEPYASFFKEKRLAVHSGIVARPFPKVKALEGMANLPCQNGFDDSLLLDENKVILECSKANFLWVHQGKLHYTDPSLPYYEGITQEMCLRSWGVVKACKIKLEELPQDACLYTSNALQGVVPVTRLGERSFPRSQTWERKFSLVNNRLFL